MTNTLRNAALQAVLPVLCALIVLNAYLVARNLKRIERSTAQRVDASEIKAEISSLAFDLQAMETSQRGYLLTGDDSYLKPYNDAGDRLPEHFAGLRSRLAGKDRALLSQLEPVAAAKLAEMNETIRLRRAGYRHRAFVIVDSNRGRQLMEQAGTMLAALSSAQDGNVARFERERRAGLLRAVTESMLGSGILLIVTMVGFLAFNRYRKRLETGYARQAEELRAASGRLQHLSSTVLNHFRTLAGQMQAHAGALLGVYGGFLPRQGQEKAQRIEDGAGQMIGLLDDLSRTSRPESAGAMHPVEISPVDTLSA